MKSSYPIVIAAFLVVTGAVAQEVATPSLGLGDGSPEPVSSDPAAPSLSGGFTAALENDVRSAELDQAFRHIENMELREARAILNRVLAVAPGNERALVGLSIIHTKYYEFKEALEVMEKLLEKQPNNVAMKNNAAWIYATADDPEIRNGHRAVTLAREALVDAPGSYHIWSTMAEGYYATGQFQKALDTSREAMRMAIQSQATSDNLREYRSQIQKSQIAVQAMNLLE